MIIVDANLLVYAHVSSLAQHARARAWLDDRLSGSAPVGLPWESALAFVRLVSNPRVFERPLTVAEGWAQVEDWLSCPPVWIPCPTERHAELLGGLLRAPGLRANHVPDAHLAALAVEHGLTVCSTDGDFARFAGVRWQNPIA
ncbi:MAG: type II toxin-antitoxin system VapC family toxin [Anaeromyxobacteraceae bacterium]